MGIAAGCGGDDDSSEARERIDYSAASEAPRDFITRMAKLLETTTRKSDCAQLNEINARSYTRFPCPAPKSMRGSMARFAVLGAEEYGTGAVVDYRSGAAKDGASIVLFVSPNRGWGIGRFGIVSGRSVETDDDESRAGFAKAVEGYLGAIRERDCDAFVEYAVTAASGRKACKTEFRSTATFAKKLKDNANSKPDYQGGNAMFGFFTLETKKPTPENVTISVVKATAKSAQPYVVLDVAPSPTAAAQARVRREFEKQRLRREREAEKQDASQ